MPVIGFPAGSPTLVEIDIWNLALQKLGAARVASLEEDSRSARACAVCYVHLRDNELRSRPWKFAIKRASIAASVTQPLVLLDKQFPDAKAYPLPADYLRLLFPPRTFNDWTLESIAGAPAIISNDAGPLLIRYIARILDPSVFDSNFTEMLACRMAMHMCEDLTQSNTKQESINRQYLEARGIARQMNAFERLPSTGPEDSWEVARRHTGVYAPWLSRQNG